MPPLDGYHWGYRRPEITKFLRRRGKTGATVGELAAHLGLQNRATYAQLVRMERDLEARRVRGENRKAPDRWFLPRGM